jgi:ADP-ribosylglycohydrolase
MDTRIARMKRSLDGLSVADGFGERFFRRDRERMIAEGKLPQGPWSWTDDTAMALSIVSVLAEKGTIDRDLLASRFAGRYVKEPGRGYGAGAHELLERLSKGEHWSVVAPSLFGGMGSLGNGGAMRVGPLGAFFADDPVERIIEEARASAAPTHAHSEGVAGAIAVALAAAHVARGRREGLLHHVIENLPGSAVRDGVVRAADLSARTDVRKAVKVLGNGSKVSAPDTVPFALWVASHRLSSFKEALWETVEAGGDMDTNCAIVGGIVGLSAEIPAEWLATREPLPL